MWKNKFGFRDVLELGWYSGFYLSFENLWFFNDFGENFIVLVVREGFLVL